MPSSPAVRLTLLMRCTHTIAHHTGSSREMRGFGRAGAQGQGHQALHRAEYRGRLRHP